MAPRKLAFVLPLLLAVPVPAYPATIRVPADQPTIQAGIDVAFPGDTVLVATGTFTGTGNRDLDFMGKAITVRSESGDPTRSIVDCQGSATDPHRGFVFQSGESRSSLLEGITIRRGCVFDEWTVLGEGGGILVSGASPTVQNCHIVENIAFFGGGIWIDGGAPAVISCRIVTNSAGEFYFSPGYGGGIGVTGGSSATISSCEVIGNQAWEGGGILADGSAAEITDCVISHNGAGGATAGGYGGGISASGANRILRCQITNNGAGYNFNGTHGGGSVYGGLIADCLIAGNRTDSGGAGIGLYGGAVMERCIVTDNAAQYLFGGVGVGIQATLRDCVIAKNASEEGGGINVRSGVATIEGCTVTENSGTTTGGGIYVRSGATAMLTRTIVWANCLTYPSPTIYVAGYLSAECSDLELAGIGGPGQITYGPDLFDADPLFCDPRSRCSPLSPLGDYHLDASSPAAPENSPGKCGLIGALPVECGVASVAQADSPVVPSLLTVRPNPVTSHATFTIDGVKPGDAIEIYGPDGRLAAVLPIDRSGIVEWRPGDLASGVYLARLRGRDGAGIKCLVVR